MTAGPEGSDPASSNDECSDGVFVAVRDGYDAVYDALPKSDTFNRLWREHAYNGEFPVEFAHIGFLTLTEAHRLLDLLHLGQGEVLVDVACGTGGPGLWMAQQSGASLVGIDPAAAGLLAARQRAARAGLDGRSRFEQGSFERTGLPDNSADAIVSIEAFQYAPDKRAAMAEFARILRPGGRLGLVCFEVDPAKTRGLPVLGVDPVVDYKPLLGAEFIVETYEETPGWQQRVYGAFDAVLSAHDALVREMGQKAASGAAAEAFLTVEIKPYPRRVLIAASNEHGTLDMSA
jgi:SAM-dependent methyltransferase